MTKSQGILTRKIHIARHRRIVEMVLARNRSMKAIAIACECGKAYVNKVKSKYTVTRKTIGLTQEGKVLMAADQETFFFMQKRRSPRPPALTPEQLKVQKKILKGLGKK